MFKKKVAVTVYLRGGQVIKFKCRHIKIHKNSNNDLTGYSADGVEHGNGDKLFYVRLDAIDSIQYEHVWF